MDIFLRKTSRSISARGGGEEVAHTTFADVMINTLFYSPGQRYYLGSFVVCGILKEDFIRSNVDTCVSVVGDFAKLAVKYPQDIYMGYTSCLQGEWQYLCKCMPNIAHLLEPLERVLQEDLLPDFLCVDSEDINNKFRELLALAVRRGGLGICITMVVVEEFYNTPLMCVVI